LRIFVEYLFSKKEVGREEKNAPRRKSFFHFHFITFLTESPRPTTEMLEAFLVFVDGRKEERRI
jgi:hypothetical protein